MTNGWNPTRSDGWFAVALRRAGIERGHMTIHDLRHTAASLMVQSGANVKTVQRQLGHKSAAMTLDVYADLFDDDLDDLSERMGGLLFSQNVGKMWAKATQTIQTHITDRQTEAITAATSSIFPIMSSLASAMARRMINGIANMAMTRTTTDVIFPWRASDASNGIVLVGGLL